MTADLCIPEAIVCEVLQSQALVPTSLYTAIGERVDIDVDPRDLDFDEASIVVTNEGFAVAGRGPVMVGRVQLKCYGGGEDTEDAKDVFRLAGKRLINAAHASVASGVLMSAVLQSGGNVVPVPQGVRPYVNGYFRVVVKGS